MTQLDRYVSPDFYQFIGVSPRLTAGAPGHYESFHKALFQGLKYKDGNESPVYLGSRAPHQETSIWYEPVVPTRLTSKFKVADFKYFKTLLKIADQKDAKAPKVFVAYEGNLYTIFLFSAVLRFCTNSLAIVNVFDNQQHAHLFESKLRTRIFKELLKIAMSGVENQLILTGDTFRFASKLQESTKIPIGIFPMFSILQHSGIETQKTREFLINLRGAYSANKLLEVCELVGSQNLPEITVHGPMSNAIKIALAQFDSLEFSEGHISESDYNAMCHRFKNVVFLYNPESFSYCSSGRLFDAVLTETKLIVPSDTALSDFAKIYGNASEFDFNKNTNLVDVLLGKTEFSKRGSALLPTVKNAVESLILLAEICQKRERSKNLPVIFYAVVTIGWIISLAGYLLFAIKNRTKNGIFNKL